MTLLKCVCVCVNKKTYYSTREATFLYSFMGVYDCIIILHIVIKTVLHKKYNLNFTLVSTHRAVFGCWLLSVKVQNENIRKWTA